MKDQKRKGIQVYVRHQDVTKEIIDICKVSKPKINCKGMFVAVPADPQLVQSDNFNGGWAMITGYN